MLDVARRTLGRNGVLVEADDQVVVIAEIAVEVFEAAGCCFGLMGGSATYSYEYGAGTRLEGCVWKICLYGN